MASAYCITTDIVGEELSEEEHQARLTIMADWYNYLYDLKHSENIGTICSLEPYEDIEKQYCSIALADSSVGGQP